MKKDATIISPSLVNYPLLIAETFPDSVVLFETKIKYTYSTVPPLFYWFWVNLFQVGGVFININNLFQIQEINKNTEEYTLMGNFRATDRYVESTTNKINYNINLSHRKFFELNPNIERDILLSETDMRFHEISMNTIFDMVNNQELFLNRKILSINFFPLYENKHVFSRFGPYFYEILDFNGVTKTPAKDYYHVMLSYNFYQFVRCSRNCLSCSSNYLCTLCAPGYFLRDHFCYKCEDQCKTCENRADNCLSCSDPGKLEYIISIDIFTLFLYFTNLIS